MYRLLYMSFTVFEPEPDICAAIVNSARRHNAINGITGALLTSGRTFLQLLEGEKDMVLRTFGRIRADPQHDGVTILHADFAMKRLTPEWAMGFFKIPPDDALTTNEAAQQNLRDFRQLMWDQNHADPIVSILLMYLDQQRACEKVVCSARE